MHTEIDPDGCRSVVDLLEVAIERYADKPAFRCLGQTLTYADTDRLSRAFAAYLQGKLGLAKGDRVAVMVPNIPAFPLATMGIVRAGAVQVNVNPLYTPRELEHQLNDAGAGTIVIFTGVTATLAEIIGKTSVERVIAVGDGAVDARLENVTSFADALEQGADLPFAAPELSGDDLLFLQYTGGTTGVCKGAALSHRNLVANTAQFKVFMADSLQPGAEVIVTALPRSEPERCRRLVLCATATGSLMVPAHPGVLLRMATPARFMSADYARRVAGDIYGGDFRKNPGLAAEVFRHVRWQSRLGYYLQLAAAAGWTSIHWLHSLRQPTLVMAGADDPIVPMANARLICGLIPDAELKVMDCGHLFLLTRAEESARAIERFLDRGDETCSR